MSKLWNLGGQNQRKQEAYLDPLMAYKAMEDTNIMYPKKDMNQPDLNNIKKAMQKEWDDKIKNTNFSIIP